MTANGELQKQIVNYAKTRAVYVDYRKAGYSRKLPLPLETILIFGYNIACIFVFNGGCYERLYVGAGGVI